MSIVVSSQDTGVCRKELTIEIPAGEVEAETRSVLKNLGKQVRIPGFRPGKAPLAVLRKRFREDVDREVLERLLPRFWQQAREEKELDVLGQPELTEVPDLVEGEPLRFVAQVEVRPPVEIGELPQVELPETAGEPGEEDVDQALDEL
jgi:trigger factor